MSTFTHTSFRSISWALLLWCSSSSAQQVDLFVLRFQAETVVDGVQEKLAMEALSALDPGVRLSLHADRLQLKIGLKLNVEDDVVREALLQAGIVATLTPHPVPPEGGAKLPASIPDGYPIFISTGNAELDNLTYQAAKAAWIQEHPQDYQKMLNSAVQQ
jgi:hypothetical protein